MRPISSDFFWPFCAHSFSRVWGRTLSEMRIFLIHNQIRVLPWVSKSRTKKQVGEKFCFLRPASEAKAPQHYNIIESVTKAMKVMSQELWTKNNIYHSITAV